MENKKEQAVNQSVLQPILEDIIETHTYHILGASIRVTVDIKMDELIIGQPVTNLKDAAKDSIKSCLQKVLQKIQSRSIS